MSKTLNPDVQYYLSSVPLSSLGAFNAGLTSLTENFMKQKLGIPQSPLNHTCDDHGNIDKASALVKQMLKIRPVSAHISAHGIELAVESVGRVLAKAIAQEKKANPPHDLESVLRSPGMICVRLKNTTSGPPSKEISNHSWGTAIDFNIVGNEPPGDTGKVVPKFIAALIPFFNEEKWVSGAGFKKRMDSMHFEVSEEQLNNWFP